MRTYFFVGLLATLVLFALIGLRLANEFVERGVGSYRFLLSQVSLGPNEALYAVSPSSGTFAVNDTFQVELRVGASEGITSMKAYLDYDPSRIAVTGMVTSTGAFSTWWEDSFDNTAGKLKFQASTPSPGFSGNNGLLATITFQVMGVGAATLTYDATSLALKADDTNILNIAASTQGGYTLEPPPDTIAPVRSDDAPTGTLSAGTTEATISLTTNENATCKYAANPGVSFASMPNTFSSTGGTSHATTVTGLSDGNIFSYYVRCQDGVGNPNASDFLIEFSVAEEGGSSDITAPARSNRAPSGTLSAGTTSATLSLTTDETATCRYSTAAETSFASMPNTFSTTGGTSHATPVSGLSDGTIFSYYVRCQDGVGNPNASDFLIEFSVASAPSPPPPGGGGGGGTPNSTSPSLGKSRGDLNGDGRVNIFDASILISRWGQNSALHDVNGDGVISIFDASIMITNWTG